MAEPYATSERDGPLSCATTMSPSEGLYMAKSGVTSRREGPPSEGK